MRTIPTNVKYLFLRNGIYLYRRAIPPELRKLAGQSEFKASLRTDVWDVAIVRYGDRHSEFNASLQQLRDGKPLNRGRVPNLETVRREASTIGLPYKSSRELIEADSDQEMWDRLVLHEKSGLVGGDKFHAIYGSVENTISLNDVLAFYENDKRDERIGLSDRETSKKLSPPRLAVKRFNEFAPDIIPDFRKITLQVAFGYRDHLINFVSSGKMKAGTANKQLMHLNKVVNRYIKRNGLNLPNPFSGLSLSEEKERRPAFTIDFLKRKWLSPNAFAGLNDEARSILLLMIDTGCGAKEIAGLDPSDIRLDDDVPHVIIRPNQHRKLKTGHRDRVIPLIANSMAGIRDFADGFPTYRKNSGADTFSSTAMKFLRNHGLLETPKHSIYGLRHTFKDRMRKHDFTQELQDFLMGHANSGMGSRYGKGYSLDTLQTYMNRLAGDWE